MRKVKCSFFNGERNRNHEVAVHCVNYGFPTVSIQGVKFDPVETISLLSVVAKTLFKPFDTHNPSTNMLDRQRMERYETKKTLTEESEESGEREGVRCRRAYI